MISRAAITPLPIWNALRRSYLNPLFLLRPIVSLPAPSQHTVVRSMVVGEEPVNRLCSSGVEKDAVHSPSERKRSRKLSVAPVLWGNSIRSGPGPCTNCRYTFPKTQ